MASGTGGLFLRKLRARVSERPTGFVWVEKGKLAGSGYPASRNQLKWLRSQGINTVLTLTEAPIPQEWLDGLGLEVRHIPMQDHMPPDVSSLREAAMFLQKSVGNGKVVLVHCLAGEGRTGCALAAYLMMGKKVAAKEALSDLRRIKSQFIERGQESTLFELGKTIGDASSSSGDSG